MVMMTSPIAMACSRPVPAMTMATGDASTMRAAGAKALMRPAIRTPREESPMTAAVAFSAAALARDGSRAVAEDTAVSGRGSENTGEAGGGGAVGAGATDTARSECGSMTTGYGFGYAAFEPLPPPGTGAPDATREMTRNPGWPMSMAANVQNATLPAEPRPPPRKPKVGLYLKPIR